MDSMTPNELDYLESMVRFHRRNLDRLLASLESPMAWYSVQKVKHWIKLERTRLKRAELYVAQAKGAPRRGNDGQHDV
jgi:hypothetical protein